MSVSIIATLPLVGAGVVLARTVPTVGVSHLVAILAGCSVPAIALVTPLFVVISYEIDGVQLRIRRLLWHIRVDLTTKPYAGLPRSYPRGHMNIDGRNPCKRTSK